MLLCLRAFPESHPARVVPSCAQDSGFGRSYAGTSAFCAPTTRPTRTEALSYYCGCASLAVFAQQIVVGVNRKGPTCASLAGEGLPIRMKRSANPRSLLRMDLQSARRAACMLWNVSQSFFPAQSISLHPQALADCIALPWWSVRLGLRRS